MAQFDKEVEKEAPSNFCGKCRKWVESNERFNVFEVEGVSPKVWNCPGCRDKKTSVV